MAVIRVAFSLPTDEIRMVASVVPFNKARPEVESAQRNRAAVDNASNGWAHIAFGTARSNKQKTSINLLQRFEIWLDGIYYQRILTLPRTA